MKTASLLVSGDLSSDNGFESGRARLVNAEIRALDHVRHEFGRMITRETVRRQRRVVLVRPLRLAVRESSGVRGAAEEESAIDATMIDASRMGIGFLSPRKMGTNERFTLTLRTGLGVVTLFYGVRRSSPAQSSLWRIGGELLGVLGADRATKAEAIVWALLRGSCPGCGN